MIEREELLALRHVGLSVTTAAGQRIYPTMSAAEVHMIRMLGANDTAESDYISERTRRAFDQSAAKGTPHGPIAYGWDRHRERGGDVVDTINAAQAEVIREAATRILAGETIRGIARDLNAREIPAPRGGRWSTTILTKIVRRERIAARRVHRGVVVGPAAWEPILDDDTFDAVVSLLNDPARRTNKIGAAPRYLLSGLIVCGKCHDTRVWVQHAAKPTTAPGYHCKSCHGLRRKAKSLDEHVIEAICARMARPDALDWLAQTRTC
jgi:site-specific DNA recombinase